MYNSLHKAIQEHVAIEGLCVANDEVCLEGGGERDM